MVLISNVTNVYSVLCLYQQLPQTNPGFNNSPFKFTKYSNAYMLVYIRESDKEKIICNVDEKDIAEHLRVRYLNCSCWFQFTMFSQINYTGLSWHQTPDKVEERTRRKGSKEKGKSRGTSLYYHKGHSSLNSLLNLLLLTKYTFVPCGTLFSQSVSWCLRLLVTRTFLSRLEGIYILILWTMTKFVVFVFRNKRPSTFSRYSLSFCCHFIFEVFM